MSATRTAMFAAACALLLAAPAARAQDDELLGTYAVRGDAGEGKEYKGTCRISKEGDCYRLRWKIGDAQTHVGLGIRQGDVLAVSFADPDHKEVAGVVAYRIRENGRLSGKWSTFGSKGNILTETLTKEK